MISGELTGGRLVVDTSAGDGFLATVLGGARLEAGFEAGLTVDAEHGVQFRGSGGIEAQLPVHIELGPVEVQTITLAAGIHGDAVMIELSAGFSANLGPVQASVERVGRAVSGWRSTPGSSRAAASCTSTRRVASTRARWSWSSPASSRSRRSG